MKLSTFKAIKKSCFLFLVFFCNTIVIFAQNSNTPSISNEINIQIISNANNQANNSNDTINKIIASNELAIQVMPIAQMNPKSIEKPTVEQPNQITKKESFNILIPPTLTVGSEARLQKPPLSSKQATSELNELKNCQQLTISYWNLAEQRRFDIHKLQDTISSLRLRVAGLLLEKNRIDAKTNYFQQQYFLIDSIKQSYAVKYKDTLIQYNLTKQYLKEVRNELSDLKTKLTTLTKENDKLREQVRKQDKAADVWQQRSNYWQEYAIKTFPYQSNIFVAINYNIPISSKEKNINEPILSKLNFSIYGFPYLSLKKWHFGGKASGIYWAGFSLGNFQNHKEVLPESNLRNISMSTAEQITNKLRVENRPFTPLSEIGRRGNFTQFSADIIFHLKKTPFFIKLGGSLKKGSAWREFEGNLLNELPKTSNNTYIIDYQIEKNFKPYFALAIVQRYVQGELGFDTRQKNLYLNLGFNIPINKYFFYADKGKKKLEEFYKEDTIIEQH